MTSPVPSPSRGQIAALAGGAFAIATVLTVLVVLPAEYGIDPTGFGRLTGLDRISAPVEVVVETRSFAPPEVERLATVPFRTDTIEIAMGGGGGLMTEVEYKVTMKPGETLLYTWSSDQEVFYDFHGHGPPDPATGRMTVMNYRTGTASEASGTLVAPIEGIHGWYFRRADTGPFIVRVTMAGYYDLAPGRLEVRGPFSAPQPQDVERPAWMTPGPPQAAPAR